MKAARLQPDEIRRLAEDTRAKILANEAKLADCEDPIVIQIYRKGRGFDIKLKLTT